MHFRAARLQNQEDRRWLVGPGAKSSGRYQPRRDLLEEIARHYGFDKFPATLPAWSGYGSALPFETEERLLRNRLAANGYSEVLAMAFSDEAAERKFRP